MGGIRKSVGRAEGGRGGIEGRRVEDSDGREPRTEGRTVEPGTEKGTDGETNRGREEERDTQRDVQTA